MSEELSGKVAIITGGASGIGRGSVELFVEEGAKVVIADVDAKRGEEFAAELGNAARFKKTDVSNRDDVQALVDFAVSEFGGLDVMFNNAGISQKTFNRFIDDDLSDFDRVMHVNLKGVMLGCQAAARYMKDHGGGCIINTGSMGGNTPGFGVNIYRSCKAAVIHFSKSMAIDFASYGIRVNCISPGQIMTEMQTFPEPGMTKEQMDRINEAMAPVMAHGRLIERGGLPRDIAQAAVFLASERASYITGVELNVDGGLTAGDPVNHLEALMAARAKVLAQMEQEAS